MWTQIPIDEKSIDQSQSRPAIRRRPRVCPTPWIFFPTVALMLQRSSPYPIDIRIDIPAYGSSRSWFRPFYIDVLASLLYPHRARIANFELTSVSWEHHTLILNIFKGARLPLLRSFTVQCPYAEEQEFSLEFPAVTHFYDVCPVPFGDSKKSARFYPSLSEISLLGTFCDWTKFAGRNLTSITLAQIPYNGRPSVKQLRSILAMSKDTLKVLKIDGALPVGEFGDGIALEMHQLETLSLFYTIPHELSLFAEHIRVPALKNLEIGNIDHLLTPSIHTETQTAFKSILRHFPIEKLEEVTLSDMQFGPGALYGLLDHAEPLELLRRLGKGLKKMRFEIAEECFLWDADAEGAERLMEAWREKVETNFVLVQSHSD